MTEGINSVKAMMLSKEKRMVVDIYACMVKCVAVYGYPSEFGLLKMCFNVCLSVWLASIQDISVCGCVYGSIRFYVWPH